MFKGHYNSIRGESRKLKSVENWMKYVGSKLFPRFVVTLWSSAKELDDFDPNHTKYEPQLVSAGIMNRSWRSLRLELTIILNLVDQIRSIEMDQKT
jgi:hypothetical protein